MKESPNFNLILQTDDKQTDLCITKSFGFYKNMYNYNFIAIMRKIILVETQKDNFETNI